MKRAKKAVSFVIVLGFLAACSLWLAIAGEPVSRTVWGDYVYQW